MKNRTIKKKTGESDFPVFLRYGEGDFPFIISDFYLFFKAFCEFYGFRRKNPPENNLPKQEGFQPLALDLSERRDIMKTRER